MRLILAAAALIGVGLGGDGRAAAQAAIMGIVRDADGPVAGAVVRVQASDDMALTGIDGRFQLEAPAGAPLTITAWREGYLVGWANATPPVGDASITLTRHYTTDNPDYDWFALDGARGSATCEHCMPSLHDQWRRDAHARSAVNPRFLSMYRGTDLNGSQSPPTRTVSERDYGSRPLAPRLDDSYFGPGYKLDFPDTPGNCATCHIPAAAARHQSAYATDPADVVGVETEGIFCEFCHKVGGVILDAATQRPYENMPGVLSMRLLRPDGPDELFFGTLDDVTRRVSKLPEQQESRFCAPCHSFSFWDTAIYDSYGEWLASPYADPTSGQTCQDCHMPETGDEFIALPEVGGVRRRAGFVSSHRMLGADDTDFIRDAVRVELTAGRRGRTVTAEVRITNAGAGHHIPTGHPARNMVLVVSAVDALDRPLPFTGDRRVPKWGGEGDGPSDLAGQPGKGYAKVLEEIWTGVWPTAAYWNPTTVREDTRIPAGATDITRYIFRAPRARGPIRVRARLVFRRSFPELARWKGWANPTTVLAEGEALVR